MLTETQIVKLLVEYGQDIRDILHAFQQEFGTVNPAKSWRNSSICRTGNLKYFFNSEYALHGAGCTVETDSERIISFDLDEFNNYTFNSFKFKLYVESLSLEIDNTSSTLLECLAKQNFWISSQQEI